MRGAVAGLVVALLAACAPEPPPPRHRCVEIPNGLVECTLVSEPAPAPAR